MACVHAFINPTLFIVLHRGLRQAALDVCCLACFSWGDWLLGPPPARGDRGESTPPRVGSLLPPPPPQPAIAILKPPTNKQRVSPMVNLRLFMWVNVVNMSHGCRRNTHTQSFRYSGHYWFSFRFYTYWHLLLCTKRITLTYQKTSDTKIIFFSIKKHDTCNLLCLLRSLKNDQKYCKYFQAILCFFTET